MNRGLIYLQSDFWSKLSSDNSLEGIRACLNVYDALCCSNIYTDIDVDQLKSDRFLLQISKNVFGGKGGDVKFFRPGQLPIEPIDQTTEQLCAIHFHECDNIMADGIGIKYGTLVINSFMALRQSKLFKGDGFVLNRHEKYEKKYSQFAPIISIPSNSMIIIDPYILSDPLNIDNSLIPWIDSALPKQKQSIKYNLSIVSIVKKEEKQLYHDDLKKLYNRIEKKILEIRPMLDLELEILTIGHGEDFHGRFIITNNILIYLIDGLDLFDNNGTSKKNATFNMVIPHLYGNSRTDLSTYYRWISIAKHRIKNKSDATYCGNVANRLFDIVD